MSLPGTPTILELFSGSKQVSSVFEQFGWNAITIDNNVKLNPSICSSILDITPDMLPNQIHFIWASPVCTQFSRAARSYHWEKITLKKRKFIYIPKTAAAEHSLKLLNKTIELILLYPNAPFIIENPIGRIHHIKALQKLGHYRYFVNYSTFGVPYSKETYLFSNMMLPFTTKKYKVMAPGLDTIRPAYDRSLVPEMLVKTIFKYLFNGSN